MAHALEMFFDQHAESAVRSMWASLEARGIRSMASSGHCRHRPHVSLVVAERIAPAQARTAIEPLAEAADLVLRLGSIAVFPGRAGVLYLGVVPTLRLLRLHNALHARLAGAGVESGRHYLPNTWVPHCTLAQGLAHRDLPVAVQAIKRLRPTDAQITSVGIVDTDTGEITTIAEPPHSGRTD